MTLLDFDREHVWHPYTSMTEPTPVRLVTGASGNRLTLDDGTELIDGMSSWWAAIHGYGAPALEEAVRSVDFAHVMFGGLTNAPAIRLAQRLVEITPAPLERVFLADSGSVSVEVALKMALQWQRGAGRPERTRMLTVRGGYHGDTFGAMSVCDPVGGMHSMFTDVLPQQLFAPATAGPGRRRGGVGRRRSGPWPPSTPTSSPAIIVEPLLQGAGGMWVYDAECLRVLRAVADEHDLLLVHDEIATGFGRTGTLFAGDAAGVVPDIMCVGKALTGGYLSLAAVICTDRVARGISDSESGVLMHGPTFMGNALACTVALASLDLLVTDDWESSVRRLHTGLTDGLGRLSRPARGRRRAHPRGRGRGAARPRRRRRAGHRGRRRGRRVAASLPRPHLHDAALRHQRPRPGAGLRGDQPCRRGGVMVWEQWLAEQAEHRETRGLVRRLHPRAADDATIDLAGNDYLGLARDPAVVAAAAEAVRTWGGGAGASRLVTGTLDLHVSLEGALAGYLAQPAALVFSTGYHANLGLVTALADPGSLVVSDAHIHASLIDAVRLSRAQVEVVAHNDVRGRTPGRGGRPGRGASYPRAGRVGLLGPGRRRPAASSSPRSARTPAPCSSSTRPTASGSTGPGWCTRQAWRGSRTWS